MDLCRFVVVIFYITLSYDILSDNGQEISGGKEAVPHEYPWMVSIIGGCTGGNFTKYTFNLLVYW